MPDHVVDTNVLVVASLNVESEVPLSHRGDVIDWLSAYRHDPARRLVLDGQWRIWNEYKRNVENNADQNLGFKVVLEKLQNARFHTVEFDGQGHALLPNDLAAAVRDRDDRKFVAVALADNGKSTLVNASDTDWYDAEAGLKEHGIVVEQLIEDWCRRKHREKTVPRSKKAAPRSRRRS
jgi:hypothetical protein